MKFGAKPQELSCGVVDGEQVVALFLCLKSRDSRVRVTSATASYLKIVTAKFYKRLIFSISELAVG